MNVYDQITANNRSTAIILIAFPVALFVLIYLWSIVLVKIGVFPSDTTKALDVTLFIYPWMVFVAFLWIVISYNWGSSMILLTASAHPVTFEENKELYRLVENTALMAGLPTPRIHIMHDYAMNAFAIGRKPEEAAIALTSGLIKELDKDELQAVIAHELAHIGNRDTRLMLITIAGIGCFIFLGQKLCHIASDFVREGSDSGGKSGIFFLVLGIICLIFGYIVAPILRFALSRRREFQADATAAKITRDPEALARALSKISEYSSVESLNANSLVGNMCIASPTEDSFLSKLYSSHPPIEDRIAALRGMLVRGKSMVRGKQ